MNVSTATLLSTEPAWDGAFVSWFHAPELARGVEPGQFVMVHCSVEGLDPMFARAFSYYRVDGDRFAILYQVVGRGTRWLSEQPTGAVVRMYGPLGKGFRLPDDPGNLLLIGGGVGIAPLVDTAERAVAAGHHVVAMMGARSESHLLSAAAWPKEVEYVVVTEDGSAGAKGYVTQHLGKYQEWASKIYACGPNPMFQALADTLRFNGRRQRPEILMEENMPCGWGMCYGCAIFTKHGVRLCCKDGPRFNLFDVY
ncbi:MAG: dihydroorotate dehydrogenase electron transfer subunit [Dehalococcoidia bacterium]|nr:dihydroorotate dehydrogenase electron transfer subunit [Dehalococcoidia bacterium]